MYNMWQQVYMDREQWAEQCVWVKKCEDRMKDIIYSEDMAIQQVQEYPNMEKMTKTVRSDHQLTD
jgi:hypothetical protein